MLDYRECETEGDPAVVYVDEDRQPSCLRAHSLNLWTDWYHVMPFSQMLPANLGSICIDEPSSAIAVRLPWLQDLGAAVRHRAGYGNEGGRLLRVPRGWPASWGALGEEAAV
jgi:hypothetical protein